MEIDFVMMADSIDIPAQVLAALGRLNAHARARGGWGTERNAIYAYKTAIALALIQLGEAGVRFVRLTSKCDCDNGWFWYDYEEKRRCRYCYGRGTRDLRFTETTLPDGQVWHHPWEGQVTPGYDLGHAFVGKDVWTDSIDWQDPGDWRPRSPAAPLPLDDLVILLNAVEHWFDGVQHVPRGAPYWYLWDSATRCLRQQRHRGISGPHSHGYRLDLGQASRCFACGGGEDSAWSCYGCLNPLFHWTLVACKEHGRLPHPQIECRDLAPPVELIRPPIGEWLQRHQQVIEVFS